MYEFPTELPYTEFRYEKSRNYTEVKALPHKIPTSAEFQKVTSVNSLLFE
jgi:hypothetical protein